MSSVKPNEFWACCHGKLVWILCEMHRIAINSPENVQILLPAELSMWMFNWFRSDISLEHIEHWAFCIQNLNCNLIAKGTLKCIKSHLSILLYFPKMKPHFDQIIDWMGKKKMVLKSHCYKYQIPNVFFAHVERYKLHACIHLIKRIAFGLAMHNNSVHPVQGAWMQ